MKTSQAAIAAAIALSVLGAVVTHAAGVSNPAQDQAENQVTAQLNQQQLQGNGGWGVLTYEGIAPAPSQVQFPDAMQEQIAQPPQDSDSLSIIE